MKKPDLSSAGEDKLRAITKADVVANLSLNNKTKKVQCSYVTRCGGDRKWVSVFNIVAESTMDVVSDSINRQGDIIVKLIN